MPFLSEAQKGWMYSNKPEMAKRWQKHTPKGKKLPKHVSKEKKAMFIKSFVQSFYDKLGISKEAAANSGILIALTKLAAELPNIPPIESEGFPSGMRVASKPPSKVVPPVVPPVSSGSAILPVEGGGKIMPGAEGAVIEIGPGGNLRLAVSEESRKAFMKDKGGPLSSLALAIGAPFVVGGLGGAGLARLLSPSHEDIGNLQKQELITQYDNAIEEMKRRIATRR